jgi:hypothetical protein
MPSFCKTHLVFYTFGRCPKCIQTQVPARNDALITNIDGRWGYLRAHPESLNQDQFGICGTSSCVYLLLRHNWLEPQRLFIPNVLSIIAFRARWVKDNIRNISVLLKLWRY